MDKLAIQLNIWRTRALTPLGKILISKCFGISQLIFSMFTCNFSDVDLKKIEHLIYNFIWSGKKPKIKKDILIGDYKFGGLKSPDITSQYLAIKLQQFIRIQSDQMLTKYCFPSWWDAVLSNNSTYPNVSDAYSTIMWGVNRELINDLKNGEPVNIDAINAIINCPADYFAKTTAKECIKTITKSYRLFSIGQVLNELRFPSDDRFFLQRQSAQKYILDHSLRDCYYNLNNLNLELDPVELISVGRNKFMKSNKLKSGIIRSRLTELCCDKLDYNWIKQRHNIDLDFDCDWNPFTLAHKANKSIRNRYYSYKILHNIYYSNSVLSKFGVSPSELCQFCNIKETKKHVLFECTRVKNAWAEIEKVIELRLGITIRIEWHNVVVGIRSPTLNNLINQIINHFKTIICSKSVQIINAAYIDKEITFIQKNNNCSFKTKLGKNRSLTEPMLFGSLSSE